MTINLSELLNLVEAYVPFIQYAGVKAEQGFTVTAATLDPLDSASGSAGGFLGYASGAQISTCDVTNLKHTAVTAPSDLEAVEAPSYFDPRQSSYAVTGGRYAGGFVGCMDIGQRRLRRGRPGGVGEFHPADRYPERPIGGGDHH